MRNSATLSSASVPLDSALKRDLHPTVLITIMIGGALGALLRELFAFWFTGTATTAFPLGILIANLSGAFLLGLFATWIDGLIRHHHFRPFWEIGFVRSFTTMSTLSLQSIVLIEAGAWGVFVPYIALSVIGGLILFWSGERLGVSIAKASVAKADRVRVEQEL
ncbi:MAG: CrcB family protein [Mariniblastus sp.]|jgi:CrcB protein|nr:CrcB family protein [Mariniblastus sp.]